MICLDNSDWTRNSDYTPTRLQAQAEAANYIANGKLGSNQETEVGILSMAGHRVELHCSMTRQIGTVMNSIQKDVRIGGTAKFVDGLKIAQLALKNRQNKNQKQRIIMFVASPVNLDIPELERLGKNFKKNAVAVDVINFGTENASNGNAAKLEALVNSANSGDNSHFLNIPPGPQILSDVILTSSIMGDAQVGGGDNADPELSAALAASLGAVSGPAAASAAPSTTAGGINYADFGIDPNLEPELAMALRMSMEDEKHRQERVAATNTTTSTTSAPSTSASTTTAVPTSTSSSSGVSASGGTAMEDNEEEELDDDELAAAIALSMTENLDPPAAAPTPVSTEAITAAVTNAVNNTVVSATNAVVDEQEQIKNALKDKEFLADLLGSAGVDSDDVAIDDILMGLGGDDEEEADKKKTDKSTEEKK